jgi:hypothetical protein
MKKMVLSALLLMSVCSVFSQRKSSAEKRPLEMGQFLFKATGIHNITGFYSSIVSRDSAVLENLSFYDKSGKEVNLYGKQVDSLLIANNCREKIYPEIKRYLNL